MTPRYQYDDGEIPEQVRTEARLAALEKMPPAEAEAVRRFADRMWELTHRKHRSGIGLKLGLEVAEKVGVWLDRRGPGGYVP